MDIWTRVCFETIVTFFFIAAVLKIYQTNKEYIFCTNFMKMYTECIYTRLCIYTFLYFKDKKHCEKIVFFKKNVKCFLKNVWGYPY